jgi:hypothetical protein
MRPCQHAVARPDGRRAAQVLDDNEEALGALGGAVTIVVNGVTSSATTNPLHLASIGEQHPAWDFSNASNNGNANTTSGY